MRSASTRQGSPATIGELRSRGIRRCCAQRFRAVIGLSVPFRPRTSVVPTSLMPRRDDAMFYQLYFQTPGVAEAELQRDVRATIAKLLYSASGDMPHRAEPAAAATSAWCRMAAAFWRGCWSPDVPLAWLSDADLDFYAGEFARTGFRGGLNWFRNLDRNWELLAPFAGARVTVPALYMAGDRDLVVAFRNMDKAIANLTDHVPRLRGAIMLPGCGHWTQQERAAEVNAAMIDFLRQL
jgi:pimeloyl-ACP methyl ester carboxylesterase